MSRATSQIEIPQAAEATALAEPDNRWSDEAARGLSEAELLQYRSNLLGADLAVTNFGGGKTHSMLALYHLFSGVETGSLEGIEPVLKDAGVDVAPKCNRAVIVGTALSPAEINVKPDGTEVRTLWGEIAWQLGLFRRWFWHR